MFNGLLWEADLWEMRLETDSVGGTPWTFEGFTSSIFGYGSITTRYTPDYLTAPKGIEMTCSASKGGSAVSQATLEVAIVGISRTKSFTGSGTDSINCRVALENVKVWMEGAGRFRLTCSSIKWYVNEVLEYTHGSVDLTSGMTGVPSSIPLIGIAPYLTASTTVDPVSAAPGGGCLPEDFPGGFGTDGHSDVSGGWRFTPVGESPVALPINLLPSVAWVTGTDTWSVSIESRFTENIGTAVAENVSKSAEVWILPNISKSFDRINTGYESLLYRWGCHRYGYTSGTLTQEYDCGNVETVNTNTAAPTNTYPSLTEFLQTVGNSLSTIEDLVSRTVYAQVNHGEGRTYSTGSISLGVENTSASWSKLASGSPSSALDHPSYFAAFTNQIVNPHWSYGLWFPSDSASSSVRWNLSGSDSPIDYWYTCRQQHITHPSLPGGENTFHRVSVVTEGITQNGVTGLFNSITGLPSPWGINRHDVIDKSAWPSSFQTNATSADRFIFKSGGDDGTGSVGSSGATITDGDTIKFAMASFEHYPFMTPTMSSEIVVGWSATNVSNVKVYAEDAYGAKVLITDNVEGTFAIPYGAARKWATTCASEYGQGYISDSYSPVKSNNVSGGVILDPERLSNIGLLPGYSPVYIVFVITKVNPALSATIDHITFNMPDWSEAQVFHESPQTSVLMFPNGPINRFGCLSFYNYATDSPISTPLVRDMGLAPTVGDMWAWINCFALGVDAQTNMLLYAQNAFVEGEEFTIVDHLWRDPYDQIVTLSTWVPSPSGPQAIIYNSYRACVPPLTTFPHKVASSASGWERDGAMGAQMISSVIKNHPNIMPYRDGVDPEPELLLSSVNVLTTVSCPSGWYVGTCAEAVDNSEPYSWTWSWDDKVWFRYRAWRGHCFVPGESGQRPLYTLDSFIGPWNMYSELHGLSSIISRRQMDTVPDSVDDVGELFDDEPFGADIYVHGDTVYGLYSDGDTKLSESNDDSETWSNPVTVLTNAIYPRTIIGSPSIVAALRPDEEGGPGVLVGKLMEQGDLSWSSEFTLEAGGLPIRTEHGTFDLAMDTEAGTMYLVAVKEGETGVTRWESDDCGRTWTEL